MGTLVPVPYVFLFYIGSVCVAWTVQRIAGGRDHSGPAALAYAGFIHGPSLVTLTLIVNEEHRMDVVGIYCTGRGGSYCRPVVNFDDDVYFSWCRARIYHLGLPDGLVRVRYVSATGLLRYTVLYLRTDLDSDGRSIF